MPPNLTQLAPATAEPLPLRDIVLPEPVGWWPPAPGWWLLALLTLLLLVFGCRFLLRQLQQRRQRQRLLKPALQQLEQIRRRFARSSDTTQLVSDLSMLIRRTALTRYPREQVAGLIGTAWLDWLDRSCAHANSSAPFSNGVGRVLVDQAYRPAAEVDSDALLELSEQWLHAIATTSLESNQEPRGGDQQSNGQTVPGAPDSGAVA
ncbi:MAG TPA: DUF4381 domain-containing protein [Gammaproteobacteria bacterium]|nr:DUF4381 domain-containing protein [Gammaproteobacteria bacterium]